MEVGHKMYDYENSREAAGLENIGWKLNPHKRVMLQLNEEDLELKKMTFTKKFLATLAIMNGKNGLLACWQLLSKMPRLLELHW